MSISKALLLALACSLPAQEPAPKPTSRPSAEPRSSTLKGRTVSISEGPTFEIPASWVARHDRFGNRIHLAPGKTLKGEDTIGDFDREFAELVDAVFDLRDCAFQGGDDGWGKHSSSYGGLTIRVYLVEASETEVEKRLDERGAKALQEILSPQRVAERNAAGGFGRKRGPPEVDPDTPRIPLEKLLPERTVGEHWRRSLFSFGLHYGDYGATAKVDVRLRGYGPRTLAFVFLHTDFKDVVKAKDAILAGVRWAQPEKREGGKR